MRIVVGGVAKSGTTALYYAIRPGMPSGTRELFEPSAFRAGRWPNVLAKILAQRGVDWSTFQGFDRKVFITRDPRDQVVSFLLYAIYNHETRVTDEEAGRLIGLLQRKEADTRSVPLWVLSEAIERITGWDHRAVLRDRLGLCLRHLEVDPEFHRVRYEDFIKGHTRALADYLGFALAPRVDVPATLRRVERTRGTGDWTNWFTLEDVDYFGPILAPAMREFRYEDDWTLAAGTMIPPVHGSAYVQRLIDEQRQMASPGSRIARGVWRFLRWATAR